MVVDYIVYCFEEIGLEFKGYGGEWYQDFEVQYKVYFYVKEIEECIVCNVIGYFDNGVDYIIVIGVYYDYLGYGIMGFCYIGDLAIYNGVDDNVSGVVGIFCLVEVFFEGKVINNNYLFIVFLGEEMGLFGLKYYV